MPDLETAIATNASQPKRVVIDNSAVEQHPLPEQIEADRYLRSNAVQSAGIRLFRLRHQGTA
jgi:hypothetical protein